MEDATCLADLGGGAAQAFGANIGGGAADGALGRLRSGLADPLEAGHVLGAGGRFDGDRGRGRGV
jgi:hypothetical protein